jgi:hypothetical protein
MLLCTTYYHFHSLQRSGYSIIFRLLPTSFIPLNAAVMAELNNSVVYQVFAPSVSQCGCSTAQLPSSTLQPGDLVSQIWSHFTIWRLLVVLLILGNLKNVPLIWHVSKCWSALFILFLMKLQLRIVNAFRFCLRTQRPKTPVTSEQLFQPLITTTHAPIMEIDFNLHSSLLPGCVRYFH